MWSRTIIECSTQCRDVPIRSVKKTYYYLCLDLMNVKVWIQLPDQMRTQVNATVDFSVFCPLQGCPWWNILGRDTEQSWVRHTFLRLFEALEAFHMDELTISRLKVTPWLRPCQKQLLLCLIQCNRELRVKGHEEHGSSTEMYVNKTPVIMLVWDVRMSDFGKFMQLR